VGRNCLPTWRGPYVWVLLPLLLLLLLGCAALMLLLVSSLEAHGIIRTSSSMSFAQQRWS